MTCLLCSSRFKTKASQRTSQDERQLLLSAETRQGLVRRQRQRSVGCSLSIASARWVRRRPLRKMQQRRVSLPWPSSECRKHLLRFRLSCTDERHDDEAAREQFVRDQKTLEIEARQRTVASSRSSSPDRSPSSSRRSTEEAALRTRFVADQKALEAAADSAAATSHSSSSSRSRAPSPEAARASSRARESVVSEQKALEAAQDVRRQSSAKRRQEEADADERIPVDAPPEDLYSLHGSKRSEADAERANEAAADANGRIAAASSLLTYPLDAKAASGGLSPVRRATSPAPSYFPGDDVEGVPPYPPRQSPAATLPAPELPPPPHPWIAPPMSFDAPAVRPREQQRMATGPPPPVPVRREVPPMAPIAALPPSALYAGGIRRDFGAKTGEDAVPLDGQRLSEQINPHAYGHSGPRGRANSGGSTWQALVEPTTLDAGMMISAASRRRHMTLDPVPRPSSSTAARSSGVPGVSFAQPGPVDHLQQFNMAPRHSKAPSAGVPTMLARALGLSGASATPPTTTTAASVVSATPPPLRTTASSPDLHLPPPPVPLQSSYAAHVQQSFDESPPSHAGRPSMQSYQSYTPSLGAVASVSPSASPPQNWYDRATSPPDRTLSAASYDTNATGGSGSEQHGSSQRSLKSRIRRTFTRSGIDQFGDAAAPRTSPGAKSPHHDVGENEEDEDEISARIKDAVSTATIELAHI